MEFYCAGILLSQKAGARISLYVQTQSWKHTKDPSCQWLPIQRVETALATTLQSGISLRVANYKVKFFCVTELSNAFQNLRYRRRHGSNWSASPSSDFFGGQCWGEKEGKFFLERTNGRTSVLLDHFNSCWMYQGRRLSAYLRAERGSARDGLRGLLRPLNLPLGLCSRRGHPLEATG